MYREASLRSFLTFVFLLLLAWRANAATVALRNEIVLAPEMTLATISNQIASVTNNAHIKFGAGVYSVPFLGTRPDLTSPFLFNLINKTNVTISGYGATILNSMGTVQAGNLFLLRNCKDIKILGFTLDGGGVTLTNGNIAALIGIDMTNLNIYVSENVLRGSIKGIKSWDNSTSISNLCVTGNTIEHMGSTNFPVLGADGSAIECVGSRIRIIGNSFRLCTKAVEFFNMALEVPTLDQLEIIGNDFKDIHHDFHIWFLPTGSYTVYGAVIIGNTFTNTPGVRKSDQKNAAICIQGANLRGCIIANNIVSGDIEEGIFDANGSMSGCIISGNYFRTVFDGLRWEGQAGDRYRGNQIIGNTFEQIGIRGIWLCGSDNVIRGNLFRNINTNAFFKSIGLAGAIHIAPAADGKPSTNNYILSNLFLDDQATPSTQVGIEFTATSGTNIVEGNQFWRVTTNIHNLGSNNRLAAVPKQEGVAILASGVATVNNIFVTTNSHITLTVRAIANAHAAVCVTNVVANTSFQIRSTSGSDANYVHWMLSERQ